MSLAFAVTQALAIGAPDPPAASPPVAEPAKAIQVVASSAPETLQPQLARVGHRQRFTDLTIDAVVVEELARADVKSAVARLSAKAAAGDASSNIALIRVQRWCARIPPRDRHRDTQLLERLRPQLGEAEAARLQTVVKLELDYAAAALTSCQQAQFDYRGIESQLRDAAAAGEPKSITELARIEQQPARAEELLQQASDKNYSPAQQALAMLRLIAVQRGERTDKVDSIRALLKQAGRTSPRAKLDLANCMATGCDGHPNDVSGALVFGMDAARDGERDAFTSIARMPWAARLPIDQRLAWQYFGQRLNEAGCYGEEYVPTFGALRENAIAYEKVTKPDQQAQARKLAEQYWQEFGSRARREQRCTDMRR